MSTHRGRRISRTTAEQLLRGEPAAPPAAADALADLLAAAAAPARESELTGEYAAVRAFREARLGPVTQPRRDSMIKTAVAKLLTLKVAAVALTATAAGGVAVAASNDTLTDLVRGESGSHKPASHPTGKPSASTEHSKGAKAAPSPSLYGLCHAYTAGAGSEHGKALESPAFTALVTAAGGKDKVGAYCTTVLAAKPGKAPTADPTTAATTTHGKADSHPTGKPTAHPTDKADTHPSGKPTSHPTGGPDSHPTGSPSARPVS